MTKKFNECGLVAAGGTVRTLAVVVAIPATTSGTLATITPPAGQRVRLSYLATISAATRETGITVNVGGSAIVSGGTLDLTDIVVSPTTTSEPQAGTFSVGNTSRSTASYIDGGTDEVIEIVKDAGSTGQIIHYAYQYLE